MTDEQLGKANYLRTEIEVNERVVRRIEIGSEIEIKFANGGNCCYTNQSKYLSDEEIAAFKEQITSTIRQRAEERIAELQKEFDNL